MQLVVAIGRDDEHRQRIDAPCEQAQHVERRAVGPVQILEHQDRRTVAQGLPQRAHDRAGGRAAGDHARELSPVSSAMSTNGPSTRGVCSASHPPASTRTARARPQNARTSVVLPMPASPATSSTRPRRVAFSERRRWSKIEI